MVERLRRSPAGSRAARGRYVASLIWPGGMPTAANDNSTRLSRHRLPIAASLALLLAAAWVIAF